MGRRMKAIIPCAGKGSRLKPLTHTLPKPLAPLANKPILLRTIELIKRTGIFEIGIIVSPETENAIKSAIRAVSNLGVKITYFLQPEPKGIPDALVYSENFLNGSPFLVFLGDNIVDGSLNECIQDFNNSQADALIVLKEVKNPERYGVVELDNANNIINVVEKPEKPVTNLALMGVFVFSGEIFHAIKKNKPSSRGELEITDTILEFIKMGKKIKPHFFNGDWYDIGKIDDLLTANRVVLGNMKDNNIEAQLDESNSLKGFIEIRQGANITNSTIIGPVSISENCQIMDSNIGPYSSIGSYTIIENSSIKNTIIMEHCLLNNIKDLQNSIIGNNSTICKNKASKGLRFFIGSECKLDI